MLAPGPFALSARHEPFVLRDAISHRDHLAKLSELVLLQKVLVTLKSSSPFKTTSLQCSTANPSLGRQENGCTWLVCCFPPFLQKSLAWVLFCCMKHANYISPLSIDKKDLVVVDNDNEMYVQGAVQCVLLHRFCLLVPSQR